MECLCDYFLLLFHMNIIFFKLFLQIQAKIENNSTSYFFLVCFDDQIKTIKSYIIYIYTRNDFNNKNL